MLNETRKITEDFFAALDEGHPDVAIKKLREGADPHQCNSMNMSALFCTLLRYREESFKETFQWLMFKLDRSSWDDLVMMLLDAGVNPNLSLMENDTSKAPLLFEMALRCGEPRWANALLDRGALSEVNVWPIFFESWIESRPENDADWRGLIKRFFDKAHPDFSVPGLAEGCAMIDRVAHDDPKNIDTSRIEQVKSHWKQVSLENTLEQPESCRLQMRRL